MSEEKKTNKLPRYTKNVFLSHIKHLTRTLNTIIEYDSVEEIHISFNKAKNKYQFFIKIDGSFEDRDYTQKSILIYSKILASNKLYNEEEILKVFNTPSINERQQKKTLDKLKELIKRDTKETKDPHNNTFFKQGISKKLEVIKEILPTTVLSEFTPKNKDMKIKTQVEKKIYYLIKNQLSFINLNKVNALENARTATKKDIESIVLNEMSIIDKSFKYLEYFPLNDNMATIREIENAIENFYDDSIEKYNLSPFTLEELKEQLYIAKYNHDHLSYIKDIRSDISDQIKSTFREYNVLIKYIDTNNKNFTTNSISRYLTHITKEVLRAKKFRGSKRRKAMIELEGFDYKFFYEMDDMKKYYYTFKMIELHKFIDKYKDITKIEEDNLKIAKRQEARVKQDLYKDQLQSKEDLEKMGMDEETLKEHNNIIVHKKIESNEHSKKLEEENLTQYEYDFNIFYEKLLEHINKTMEFNSPISLEEFDEYYEFINSTDQMREYFEDLFDIQSAQQNILECEIMVSYINQFSYSDIINRINGDISRNEELEKQKELVKIQKTEKYKIDEDIEEPF